MPSGVIVSTRTAPPASGTPTNTGTAFLACSAGVADTAPHLVQSIADFEAAYGVRAAGNSSAWDWVDTYLREAAGAGPRVYVASSTGSPAHTAALALFDPKLGPGQVAAIGEAPGSTLYTDVETHCQANNRVGLLDVASTDTTETLLAAEGGFEPSTGNGEYAAAFGPWVTVPAPAGYSGIGSRNIPASAVVAALCTRADALGNPNRAPLGRDFPLQYVSGLLYSPTSADIDNLLTAGVNSLVNDYGVLDLYGFQTKIAQSTSTPFWQFNCSRARMWLKAKALDAGANYFGKPIDGKGLLAGHLKSDLDAIFLDLYGRNGLYGATAADAFSTNVGASINTTATAANAQLKAVGTARLSLYAKEIDIDLVSVPVAGTVS